MHAKEIGLRIGRARIKLFVNHRKKLPTHRSDCGRHDDKELKVGPTFTPTCANNRGRRTHRNQSPLSAILHERWPRRFEERGCRQDGGGHARLDRVLDIVVLHAGSESPQRQLEPPPGG